MRNNSVKILSIRTSGSGDVVSNIFYLELGQPSCLAEQNHLCNNRREHYGEQSCKIILNLDLWFRRRYHLKEMFTDNGRWTKTNHNS